MPALASDPVYHSIVCLYQHTGARLLVPCLLEHAPATAASCSGWAVPSVTASAMCCVQAFGAEQYEQMAIIFQVPLRTVQAG